jgi:hypothetical protein
MRAKNILLIAAAASLAACTTVDDNQIGLK